MRALRLLRYGLQNLHWIAVTFWAVLIVVTTTKFLLKPNMHSVYPGYAFCARAWWNGDLFAMDRDAIMYSRQYSPAFTELLAPFSMLPDPIGGALWFLVSVGTLLTGFHRFLALDRLHRQGQALAFLILPWMGLASIYNGQANILMIGCMVWSVTLIARQQWWLGALMLALPVAFKTYPIALVMLLLPFYWRRLAIPFVSTLVGLYLLPFLFHPVADVMVRYQEWLAFLISGEQYARFEQVDFRSFLARAGLVIPHAEYIWMQAATGLFALVCLKHWHDLEPRSDGTLGRNAFILSSLWMVCFGPATEEATYLLAGPAVAWILVRAIHRDAISETSHDRFAISSAVTVVLIGLAIVAGPLQTSILGEGTRQAVHYARLAPLCMLLFTVTYLWQETRSLQGYGWQMASRDPG